MNTFVQFNVSREDDSYTNDGVNVPIVTHGTTFEESQDNIRDAVALFFEGDDPFSFGFAQTPAILNTFEMPSPL